MTRHPAAENRFTVAWPIPRLAARRFLEPDGKQPQRLFGLSEITT
jgi:hypothetical protein